jgi:alpha-1,3-glucan synthase
MLDFDGYRFDKATQVTVDAQGDYAEYIRACAAKLGKDNFFMPGEITGGNTFASIYVGRGREPEQFLDSIEKFQKNSSKILTLKSTENEHFLRDDGKQALDAAAFHYSIYRNLLRFLGMDGNLTAGFDVDINFVNTWNRILATNDMINPTSKEFDPR